MSEGMAKRVLEVYNGAFESRPITGICVAPEASSIYDRTSFDPASGAQSDGLQPRPWRWNLPPFQMIAERSPKETE